MTAVFLFGNVTDHAHVSCHLHGTDVGMKNALQSYGKWRVAVQC